MAEKTVEQRCYEALKARGVTFAAAESCTGGLIAKRITDVPGVSGVFMGGVVSYTNIVKHRVLGVPADMLEEYGAVSAPVARAMAEGARKATTADCAVSVTGVAGPDRDERGNPVGTVFIGFSSAEETIAERFDFGVKSRAEIREEAADEAFKLLEESIRAESREKGENMKRNTGLLLVALLAALTLLVSGCGEKQETPDGAPDEPLMQEEDLTIEPQPDANFTLELPDGFLSLGADYEPNGKTENTTYDSDGMLPYDFARHYDADAQLVVGTDYYPETGREVISYLRTSAVGVGTPRGVKVGDSEKALLTEYPEALYCIAADESELYDGYSDESGYSEPAYDFDRAYVWQPQTPQDDGNYDVRDIAFYLKDGTVSAITMTKPYAFRFAYGVDRDAALRLAEENRSALCGQ